MSPPVDADSAEAPSDCALSTSTWETCCSRRPGRVVPAASSVRTAAGIELSVATLTMDPAMGADTLTCDRDRLSALASSVRTSSLNAEAAVALPA